MTQETTIAIVQEQKVPTQADMENIVIEYANPTSSITIFDWEQFPFAHAKAAKQIVVEVMAKTKTRYYIGLRHGGKYESVHIKPAGSENLKFYEQPMVNNRTGKHFNYYFFLASKKQGVKAMEDHIRRVILQLFDWYDQTEPFKVILWTGRDYRLLQSIG